jgi:hypothetical protein
MPVSIIGNSGIQFPDSSLQAAAASPYVLKNRIINGAMQIWQRGTSFSASGVNYYTADRWQTLTQIGTYSQSTDVPTGFQYSLSIACTSAYYGTFAQRIEANNTQDLVGQSITVSFWAKATVGGASGIIVGIQNPTAVDNYTAITNISSFTTTALTSTWTKYTGTFTSLPSGVANGLQLYIFNAAGGSSAITYLVTGVQLEVGSTATPFERRLYNQELANCQRYYYRNTASALYSIMSGTGIATNTTVCDVPVQLPVTMRTYPTTLDTSSIALQDTITVYSTGTWTINTALYSTQIPSVRYTHGSAVLTQYRPYYISANNNSSAYLGLGAEL